MAIDISSTTRRIVYTGSAGVGPYSFAFEVLAQTDIAVYFNTTELTLTTDYTVSLNVDGTGSVTIVTGSSVPSTPTASDRITIVGDRTIQRTTDFTTGGPLFATSLNDEFDSQTIFVQQVQEQADRSLRAPNTDPSTVNMVLPVNTTRANKFLSFNSNGDPQTQDAVGTYRGNWTTSTAYYVQDVVKDTSNSNIYICLVAHTSSGSLPISTNADAAKWSLVVDAVTASGYADEAEEWATKTTGIVESTDYSAKAWSIGGTGVTSTASRGAAKEWATTTGATVDGTEYSAKHYSQAAATSASNAATSETNAAASYDAFDDRYLGAKASAPTTDNDGDPLTTGCLYFNTTLNQLYIWTGSAWDAAAFTASGAVTSFNTRTGAVTLNATDVNNALGYTAQNAATAVSAINDLSDVTITSPSINQTITYNGSAWVNSAAAASALGDLSDVTITSPSTNQVLTWNGSAWINQAGAAGGIALTDLSVTVASAGSANLAYNNTSGVFTYTPPDLSTYATASSTTTFTNKSGNISQWTNDSNYATTAATVAKTASTGSGVLPAGTDAQRDGSPVAGYLRFNTTSTSFEGYDGSAWGAIGGGASAGGAIYENNDTITSSYTIAAGKNGHSVGPITISSGAAVTITSGQRWVVA